MIEPPRFLIERPANTQASGTLPPTLAADATTMSTNDVQVSPSTEGSVRQASTNSLSNGTYIIKTTYLVRIPEGSAAEESQSTSPSAPPASSRAEPSITPTATPNQSPRARQPVDRATQTDQAATTDTQASSRPVIADGPAPEFLGLLRAWRAAFMNLPDELLAEAGLRITGGGTATQETRVDQVRSTALSQKSPAHPSRCYLDHRSGSKLTNSRRGRLSQPSSKPSSQFSRCPINAVSGDTFRRWCRDYWLSFTVKSAPKPAAAARWIRFRSPGGELEGRSTTAPLTNPGILEKSGARPSLETSHPDTVSYSNRRLK